MTRLNSLLRFLRGAILLSSVLFVWPASRAQANCSVDLVDGTPAGVLIYQITGGGYLGTFGLRVWVYPVGPVVIAPNGSPPIVITDGSGQSFLNALCGGPVSLSPGPALQKSLGAKSSVGQSEPFGQAVTGFTAGDFNGDGILDTATVGNEGVTVDLFNTDGSVLAEHGYGLPAPTEQGIVAADFNGDGKVDLVILQDPIGTATSGSVALLLGNGDGTFGAPVTILTGIYPNQIMLADFNGDGKPDVGITGFGASSPVIGVLLSNGDGTFGAAKITPLIGFGNGPVAAGDITGDGKIDVIFGSATQVVAVYPGNGDGTFKTPVQTATGAGSVTGGLAYADINGDGKVDYLIVDPVRQSLFVGLGNGDGSFQASQQFVAPANAGTVSAIPLGDGTTAILMGDSSAGALVVAFSEANGQVSLPTVQILGGNVSEYAPTVQAADLNGDKKPDLIIGESLGVLVELGNGNETFAAPVLYPTAEKPFSIAIVDLNGDGKPDLFVTGASGGSILLNNGDGTFHDGDTLGGGPSGYVALADFNGDGKPDIAVASNTPSFASQSPSTVSVLLNQGDGTLASPLTLTLPAAGPNLGGGLVSGDFNGDGKADLIANYISSDGFSAALAFYPGNGNGSFGAPSVVAVSGDVFAGADFNGDGKLDLAVYDIEQGAFSVLLGNGDGTFGTPMTFSTTGVSSILVADLNGDGKPDLVLGACCGNAEASYLLGNGNGTFGAQTYFLSGPDPSSLAVADFDGSGAASVAIAGQSLNTGDASTLVIAKTTFPLNVAVVSSAYPQAVGLAPGMLATAYGTDLATTSNATSLPLPTTDSGTSVSITDSSGTVTAAPLLYISPGQVNLEIPLGVAMGPATIDITSGDGTVSGESVNIGTVAPGVFELNGNGLAAADSLTVSGNTQTYGNVYAVSNGSIVPNPIVLTGQVYLILYGTGFQGAGTAGVTVSIGGVNATVSYAGASSEFAGLDQANVLIPASLSGRGNVTVQLIASGVAANPVNVTIQ
jgi:uncharacterized protein (TIGR03437 family)